MDVTLNQVQRQLGDALRRWIERAYRFETRKAIAASAAGVSAAACCSNRIGRPCSAQDFCN